jgi:hypothetical protein
MSKTVKILTIVVSFIFLTGFVIPITALLGPAATIVSSGNVYKAGVQFMFDQTVQKKTGKNSLTLVKDEIDKKRATKDLNQKLKILVEKRINLVRNQINFENINQ